MQLGQGRFGPLKFNVTLDGSGYGVVQFQPNGSIARLTNIFVQVSSVTAQAVCRIYRGQLDTAHIINQTNSGSTGAAASGTVDVMDGEILYVEWTGGTPGAVATVTFVGHVIPFSMVASSYQLTWDNPIAANDGSLIFPALKSPNYVAGVAGWQIARNGDVEFNDAVIRGSLIAGNGEIVLDDNGLRINDPSGSFVVIDPDGTRVDVQMNPPDSATPGVVFDPAHLYTSISIPADNQASLFIESPSIVSPSLTDSSYISLRGEGQNGRQSQIFMSAEIVNFAATDSVIVGGELLTLGPVTGNSSPANSAAIGAAFTTILSTPAMDWRENRAYQIEIGGRISSNTANVTSNVAVSSNVGTTLAQFGNVPHILNGTNYGLPKGQDVFTTGATSLNRSLNLRIQVNVGTVQMIAPFWIQVFDKGPSINYPDAAVLV